MSLATAAPVSPDPRPLDDERPALAVETGGAEPIPLHERHGRPLQLLWMWTSPNMEFATVFVGAIAVLVFGLSFWQAVAAILLGNAVGALFHGVLSTWGPQTGLGQMALGRKAFGFWGNLLPAGLNSTLGGIGWLTVNSVSGSLALSTLTGWSPYLCLGLAMTLTLVIAFFGHDVVQLFEKAAFPLLTVVFTAGVVVVLLKTDPGASHQAVPGAFWIVVGSSFGYTGSWTVGAADYARYLRPDQARRAGLFAAIGNFTSSTVLQLAGVAAVTAVGVSAWNNTDPAASYTSLMPGWLGHLTLIAIVLGTLSANSVNLYSSALSFAAMGIKLPGVLARYSRATISVVTALTSLTIGMLVMRDTADFGDFLLVSAYWTGPWLGVVLADRLFWRVPGDQVALLTDRSHRNWAGPISMVAAALFSIALFSNQAAFVGLLVRAYPGLGDLTFEVGIGLAFVLYRVLRPRLARV